MIEALNLSSRSPPCRVIRLASVKVRYSAASKGSNLVGSKMIAMSISTQRNCDALAKAARSMALRRALVQRLLGNIQCVACMAIGMMEVWQA